MYVNYLNDRHLSGYECIVDIKCGKRLVLISDEFMKNSRLKQKRKICILLLAMCISFKNVKLIDDIGRSYFFQPTYVEIINPNSRYYQTNQKKLLRCVRGGCNEQDKLIKSILAKTPESDLKDVSINKRALRLLEIVDSVISDQGFWRIAAELQKPYNFHKIQTPNQVRSVNRPSRPRGFEKVKDDFESRLAQQKVLNQHESKLLRLDAEHRRSVNRCNKMASIIKQEKIVSNINSLGPSECPSPLFGRREKVIISAVPSSQESNISPTLNLFASDSLTGEVYDINIAFNHFKERMTQIGLNYTGKKQEYYFEQLNQCDIERFKALSTEKGLIRIYNIREAETMLQCEFEGFQEVNSITRPTKDEIREGNVLDGRFRKGLLSGESNTLNEQYTDLDVKLLVSDKTLQYQADQRKILGQKNPNKISMYEQGKNMGSSIVDQKYKHCNPNKRELPSSFDNVKHIVNTLELLPSEVEIAKAGVLDGARIAWADKKNVSESSISDQTALQGIIFLNEAYTIERVN